MTAPDQLAQDLLLAIEIMLTERLNHLRDALIEAEHFLEERGIPEGTRLSKGFAKLLAVAEAQLAEAHGRIRELETEIESLTDRRNQP